MTDELGAWLAIYCPLLVELQAAHAKSQLLQVLIRRLLHVVVSKGPHSRLGSTRGHPKAQSLKPGHAIDAVFPLAALDLDVPEIEVPAHAQPLEPGLLLLGLGRDIGLALEDFGIGIEASEAAALACRSGRFALDGLPCAFAAGGRRRSLYRRRLRGRDDFRCGGAEVAQKSIISSNVLESPSLEGTDSALLLFRCHFWLATRRLRSKIGGDLTSTRGENTDTRLAAPNRVQLNGFHSVINEGNPGWGRKGAGGEVGSVEFGISVTRMRTPLSRCLLSCIAAFIEQEVAT